MRTIKLFVASPGDVQYEREALSSVVNELNRTIRALLPGRDARLELVRWETNSYPAMGRPQQVILDQIGPFDIFVGILWQRFGTPTGKADSGTEEEFRMAYDAWETSGKPHILFYFNRAAILPPREKEQLNQLSQIADFRATVSQKGLVWEYNGAVSFADVIRPHITEVVGTLLAREAAGLAPAPGRDVVSPAPKTRTPSDRVVITGIGPNDAHREYFGDRLVGKVATIIEIQERPDGWSSGSLRLAEPVIGGDEGDWYFLQVKYRPV